MGSKILSLTSSSGAKSGLDWGERTVIDSKLSSFPSLLQWSFWRDGEGLDPSNGGGDMKKRDGFKDICSA